MLLKWSCSCIAFISCDQTWNHAAVHCDCVSVARAEQGGSWELASIVFVFCQCVWAADGRGGQQHAVVGVAVWEEQGECVSVAAGFDFLKVVFCDFESLLCDAVVLHWNKTHMTDLWHNVWYKCVFILFERSVYGEPLGSWVFTHMEWFIWAGYNVLTNSEMQKSTAIDAVFFVEDIMLCLQNYI